MTSTKDFAGHPGMYLPAGTGRTTVYQIRARVADTLIRCG